MKKTFLQFILITTCVLSTVGSTYAARMFIVAPKTASANGAPLSLSVYIDTEGQAISGLAGDFSFTSKFFDVANIQTNGSVISLWAVTPHTSPEINFDGRTHIRFDGIIPGGFRGVKSAYSNYMFPGAVFTVTLIPKEEGRDIFLLSDVEVRQFDENATLLSNKENSSSITIPKLTSAQTRSPTLQNVKSETLSLLVHNADLVNNNATYVFVTDSDTSHTIDHIEIAENSTYDSNSIPSYGWHRVDNPFVLENQRRNTFLNVKVIYADNTYTIETIPPVENLREQRQLSRILIGILVGVLALLYFYAKKSQHFFKKSGN